MNEYRIAGVGSHIAGSIGSESHKTNLNEKIVISSESHETNLNEKIVISLEDFKIMDNLKSPFKYWQRQSAEEFIKKGNTLKIRVLDLKKIENDEILSFCFSITKQNVNYHTDDSELYRLTNESLHNLMLFNKYHFVSFSKSDLSDKQKIHLFKEMCRKDISFLPLFEGFYTNVEISINYCNY